MSARNSALASLTATYTDSENEDDNKSDRDSDNNSDGESSSSQARVRSRQQTPMRDLSETSVTPPPNPTSASKVVTSGSAAPSITNESSSSRHKALRLVSYFDDTVVSDEENASPPRDQEEEPMDVTEVDVPSAAAVESPKKVDRAKLYGFSLPPEPKGKCSIELQEKISNLYEKMRNSNMDTNKIIQERKEFRNPSIYEKLIQFCDINELGTNYSPDIFDPFQWGKESYYEELAKAQKLEMEKVEKARKENAKTEIQVGVKKMDSDDSKKRKSKWDQPGVLGAAPGAVGAATAAALKPAGIITQTLTTTATGTKGTVISAFGSLPKKPKV